MKIAKSAAGGVSSPAKAEPAAEGGGAAEGDGGGGSDSEESDEEEEIPEDLAGLSPEEQQARIKKRAFGKMALGTFLVLAFSDPMCGCLGALGERTYSS